LVVAPLELRIQRVMQRDLCTEEEVKERMKTQWSDELKIPFASAFLTNNGHEPLLIQIEGFLSHA
jgi:dephospho-CoA kinase